MSYDLGNTGVITYKGQDVKKLILDGAVIWEKPLFPPGIYPSPEISFTSKDYLPARGRGYFKYDNTHGWMTRSSIYQSSGGITADSGWCIGSSYARAGNSITKVCIPENGYNMTVPRVMMTGFHSTGPASYMRTSWFCVWDYSGVFPTVIDAKSAPAGWKPTFGNYLSGCTGAESHDWTPNSVDNA